MLDHNADEVVGGLAADVEAGFRQRVEEHVDVETRQKALVDASDLLCDFLLVGIAEGLFGMVDLPHWHGCAPRLWGGADGSVAVAVGH